MRKEMSRQIAEETAAPFASSAQGVRKTQWNEHFTTDVRELWLHADRQVRRVQRGTFNRPVSCFRYLVQFLNRGCCWSLQFELVV